MREQGYTQAEVAPGSVELVREMTDPVGDAEALGFRRGTLLPEVDGEPVRRAGGWEVVFRYAADEHTGRGRMLVLPDEGHPHFVHQDLDLEWRDALGQVRVVEARLEAGPSQRADCGTLHIGTALPYGDLQVLEGSPLTAERVAIVHGCVELPRADYGGPHGGALTAFTAGDRHRLELVPAIPRGVTVLEAPGAEGLEQFWALRADPAGADDPVAMPTGSGE